MESFSARRKPLTYASTSAFELATAGITDPIMAIITTTPQQFGVKVAGSYTYHKDQQSAVDYLQSQINGLSGTVSSLSGTVSSISGQVSSNSNQIAAQNEAISILSGQISASFLGGFTRGVFNPFTVGDTSLAGVEYYAAGYGHDSVKNPMTGILLDDLYAGDTRNTFWIDNKLLGRFEYDKSDVALGGEVFYLKNVVADDNQLRLYDTQENAENAGNTGWIGVFPTIPDMTPGTWKIRRAYDGVPTDDTMGWLISRTGVNFAAFGPAVWPIYLRSRDFSFQTIELQAGFEMEAVTSFKAKLDSPISGYPYATVNVTTAGGYYPLNVGRARVKGWPESNREQGLFTARIKVSVLDRYGSGSSEYALVRTTITWDDVESHIGEAEYTKAIGEPSVHEVLVQINLLSPGHNFLEISLGTSGAVYEVVFCGASMSARGPAIIP